MAAGLGPLQHQRIGAGARRDLGLRGTGDGAPRLDTALAQLDDPLRVRTPEGERDDRRPSHADELELLVVAIVVLPRVPELRAVAARLVRDPLQVAIESGRGGGRITR